MRRRGFLLSLALMWGSAAVAKAKVIFGGLPWTGSVTPPPEPVVADGWKFFTAPEAALVEAIADRLIPADELSIGGKEAGCAVFIDAQLAGDYGRGTVLYREGPFKAGSPQQGPQYRETPAERYRIGLAAFDAYVLKQHGRTFSTLAPADQDALLSALEKGAIALPGIDGKSFFALLLINVREGFFADPIYGGNKDMAGWKMLGFPGAQYDFRDVVGRRGQKLEIQPISLIQRKS